MTTSAQEPWTDLVVTDVLEVPDDSSFRVTLTSAAGRTGHTGLSLITVESIDAYYLDGKLRHATVSGSVQHETGGPGAQEDGLVGDRPGQALAEAIVASLPRAIAVTRDARVGATYLRFADLPVQRTESVNDHVNADYSGQTIVGIELL